MAAPNLLRIRAALRDLPGLVAGWHGSILYCLTSAHVIVHGIFNAQVRPGHGWTWRHCWRNAGRPHGCPPWPSYPCLPCTHFFKKPYPARWYAWTDKFLEQRSARMTTAAQRNGAHGGVKWQWQARNRRHCIVPAAAPPYRWRWSMLPRQIRAATLPLLQSSLQFCRTCSPYT